ncbi:MAG: tetratricopeptide repeat protein [Rhizobacter sp.]|nr:tetratricopeptide repeat protein [Rhizobacter sp.]
MATPLDLQEQEQLDQLKDFWKQYGNLITWVLIAAMGSFAAWNGWNWWQRDQAGKASAMFDELEKAVAAGDAAKAGGVFSDMKNRFPGTTFTQQGGLLAAKLQFETQQTDAAVATLNWVGDNASQPEYQSAARLRLAGVLLEQKKFDEALKALDAADAKEFSALVADRRGDVLKAQGKPEEAKAAYLQAWKQMPATIDYRRLVEAKLAALGAAPEAEKPRAGSTAP